MGSGALEGLWTAGFGLWKGKRVLKDASEVYIFGE